MRIAYLWYRHRVYVRVQDHMWCFVWCSGNNPNGKSLQGRAIHYKRNARQGLSEHSAGLILLSLYMNAMPKATIVRRQALFTPMLTLRVPIPCAIPRVLSARKSADLRPALDHAQLLVLAHRMHTYPVPWKRCSNEMTSLITILPELLIGDTGPCGLYPNAPWRLARRGKFEAIKWKKGRLNYSYKHGLLIEGAR
jgi:hypothetical protein